MDFLGQRVVRHWNGGQGTARIGIVGDDVEIQGVVDKEPGTVGRNSDGAGVVSQGDATPQLDLGVIVIDRVAEKHVVGTREDDEKPFAVCRDIDLPGIGGHEVTEKRVHRDPLASSALTPLGVNNSDVGENGALALGGRNS